MMTITSLDELDFWVRHAEVGDDVAYHQGWTVMETYTAVDVLVDPKTRDPVRVPLAQRMWELAVRGEVFLFRTRVPDCSWDEYRFCARKLSNQAGRVLRPRDKEVVV